MRLIKVLKAEGHEVWWDQQLDPGIKWDKAICGAIDAAKAVLFVISSASLSSERRRRELAQAILLGKRLIPLLLQEANTVPDELKNLAWIDFQGVEFDDAVQRLHEVIEEGQASPKPSPAPTKEEIRTGFREKLPFLAWGWAGRAFRFGVLGSLLAGGVFWPGWWQRGD